MSSSRNSVDSLRLSVQEHQAILEQMEQHSGVHPKAELRRSRRFRYVVPDGIIVQVSGATTSYLVRPRNLSETGISFLHGSFLYPGTACSVTLKTIDGEQVLAGGRIVRCRCVRGRVHEVAVQFDSPIDIANFVRIDSAREIQKQPPAAPLADYPQAEVVALANKFSQLSAAAAPRAKLRILLRQLVELLSDSPPTASTD